MIVIVDYNCGNLGSVQNMIRKLGFKSVMSSDPEIIRSAEKLILPGVGSFDTGMKQLNSLNLIEILNQKVMTEKVPVLGICLGMQLMTKASEEGVLTGLSWVDAEVLKFSLIEHGLKVPHMGWNFVNVMKETKLTSDMFDVNRFYFVHSFYVRVSNRDEILFETNYGNVFTSGFEKENILGVQFHPEKSHKFGLKLLSNFLNKY